MTNHSQRIIPVLLVAIWSSAFLGIRLWDHRELDNVAAQKVDEQAQVDRHVVSENLAEGGLWLLGTSGILFSYLWFRRLDAARMRALTGLHKTERRWEAALDAVGDGLWEWNGETNEVFYSTRWKAILGYTDAEFPNRHEKWLAHVHPDDRTRVHEAVEAHYEGKTPRYVCEYRLRRKDGSYAWVLARGLVISRAPDGRALRAVGTHTDITARRQIVEELSASEEYGRFFMENSTDPMVAYVLPVNGRASHFIKVNDATCRLSGYSRETLLSLSPIKIEQPPSEEEVARRLRELRDKKSVIFETQIVKADGGLVPVEINAELLEFKGQPTVLANIRDLSPRRAAEVRQRKDVAQARLLLELYATVPQMTERQIFDHVIERAVELTESTIGFLHLVSDDQNTIILTTWNKGALQHCTAGFETHYPLAKAGNWADCVRERRSVIYNDFAHSPHQKGLPAGHTPLLRFMSIPVIDEDKVRIIFGVGNKASDYDDENLARLQVVAAELQKVLVRQRADRALADSELRHRQLFEGNPSPMWIFERVTLQFLAVNEAALRHYGYTRQEFLRLTLRDVRSAEDVAAMEHIVLGPHSDYSRVAVPSRHLKKNGEKIDVEVSSSGLIWEGRPARCALIIDITQHKRMEEALRESLAHLRAIVETTPGCVKIVSPEGKILSMNPSGLGFVEADGREDVIGLSMFPLIAPEDRKRYQKFHERVCAGEADSLEFQIIGLKGTRRWMESFAVPFKSGADGQIKQLAITHDVTQRKADAEMLAYHAVVLAEVPDGIISTDREWRIRSWNRGAESIYGWTEAEVLGGQIDELCQTEFVDASQRQARTKLVRDGVWRGVLQQRRKNGQNIFVQVHVSLLLDENGEIAGGVTIISDITAARQVEAALRASEEKFSLVFRHAPVLLSISNLADGTYLDVNEFALEISGYSRAEVIGHTSTELKWVTPEDRGRMQRLVGEQGRILGEEFCFRAKDGREIYALVHGEQIVIGGQSCLLTVSADITERKRMEAALQTSEVRFRGLFDSAPIGIMEEDFSQVQARFDELRRLGVTDFARHLAEHPEEVRELADRISVELINDRGSAMLGRGQQDKTLRKLSAGFVPGSWPAMRAEFVALAEGKTSFVTQIPVQDSRGGERMLELTLAVQPGHEKTLGRVVVTFVDITERQQVERQLRKLSRAVEQSPVTVVITDRQGVIEYANPQFVRSTGYTLEETRGSTMRILKSGEQGDDVYRELWSTITAGREWRGELCNRRKDDTLYWEETSISPVFDEAGVIINYLAVKEDITDRREAVHRLQEQAALLNIAREAIIVLGLDGMVRFWNRGAERIYGYTEAETLGKEIRGFLYDGDSHPAPDSARQQIVEQGEWAGELRQLTKSRATIVAEVRGVLMRDPQGAPYAILLTTHDVTEAKRLEGQYLRAQRIESLGSLAGGVAHDLNNVLTPILVAMDLLKPLARGPQDREVVQMVADSARRGAEIVQQLLLYGRGSETPRTKVDIAILLRGLERMMQETFPKNITLRVAQPKGLWDVEADQTQLHQVLLNLAVNARDAMPRGGDLEIVAENVQVDEDFARQQIGAKAGLHVAIRVVDTGMGIAAAIAEKIFDPFFTTKPTGQGTGLGLATVLGIVRSHGGFVKVDSQLGHGATFTFFFPALLSSAQAELSEVERAQNAGRGELVLVVDDEIVVRGMLKLALKKANYQVLVAVNGAEALAVFAKHRQEIRLVLTDMMMPIMDGMQLLHALQRLDATLPAIAMSGQRDSQKELETNFGDRLRFLPKPFLIATVLQAARELIDQAKARKAAEGNQTGARP